MDATRTTDTSYGALYRAFVETARELGVTPRVQINPIKDFGRRAAELLEARIAGGSAAPPRRVEVAPEIIEQERTAG